MSGIFLDQYTTTVNGNGTDLCNNNQIVSNKKRRLDDTMETPGEALLLRGKLQVTF